MASGNFDFPLILLAAGKSSRMGMPKGLLEIGDHTLLENQLKCFRIAGGSQVVLALGEDREQYFERLPGLKKTLGIWKRLFDVDLLTLINPNPDEGPFSSLLLAVEAVQELKRPAAFILPVDVPAAGGTLWRLMANEMRPGVGLVKPVHLNKGGHPVLVSSPLLKNMAGIKSAHPEARLDLQLNKLPQNNIHLVKTDDAHILINLNDPEQYRLFLNRHRLET
ncbi:MAG: NTP transferase domain-containing protein [Deltaproteobacteria bacterium]|nr:NTP transferase domain-containing protein [Deltaproteobacteria bacterium]